jgi:hypothetical protein
MVNDPFNYPTPKELAMIDILKNISCIKCLSEEEFLINENKINGKNETYLEYKNTFEKIRTCLTDKIKRRLLTRGLDL